MIALAISQRWDPTEASASYKHIQQGDSSIDLPKVKVPSEVVGSQDKLTEYLRSKQESGYEFVFLDEVNVWEADPEAGVRAGKFRFA